MVFGPNLFFFLALHNLGAEAEAGGGMVPDGVVPSALVDFLVAIGVRRGEARETAARTVAATCEAVQRTSLARARETAAQLDGLGVHAPELLGGASRPTAQCDTCDDVARWLFHVKAGTVAGDMAVRLAAWRAREAERSPRGGCHRSGRA